MSTNENKDRKAAITMIRAMLVKPATTTELAVITGWNERTVRLWIEQLRNEKMSYIAGWDADALGRFTIARHAFGFHGIDMDKPAPKTGAERTAKYLKGKVAA